MTQGGPPTFDPGDSRAIDRRRYYEGRRMARLIGHLRPTWQAQASAWDELAHRLACWPGATQGDVGRLLADALEAGRCSTVDALTCLEATAARYMGGDRWCAVCDRLAPLRDAECPDCCH